jgi:hypothetical protein
VLLSHSLRHNYQTWPEVSTSRGKHTLQFARAGRGTSNIQEHSTSTLNMDVGRSLLL